MTVQRQGRGRPKGTGLDDSAHLKAIADLIAANPELRPTTAIKDLGITDPSVIRRLRDKFHAVHGGIGTATGAVVSADVLQPHRTVAAAAPRGDTLSAPAPAARHAVTNDSERGSEPDAPASASRGKRPAPVAGGSEAFAKLFGISVGVFITAVEAQATIGAYCLRHAPVGALFQTHVAFAEAALSFAADLIPPVTLA